MAYKDEDTHDVHIDTLLSTAIDSLADMQREFYDRHDEADFDDWSRRLGVVIDALEKVKEKR